MHRPSTNAKLYIVVKSDLPPGLAAAQAVHAAFSFARDYPKITWDWDNHSQFLILLESDDLFGLIKRYRAKCGPVYSAWWEPDMDNQLTAVAFQPGPSTERLMANLPLLGKVPAVT